MPWMPSKFWALMAAMTVCVLLPPMPSMMGNRPLLDLSIVLITKFFSSIVSVGASDVVPNTTKKSAPLSMTWLTIFVKASTSTEKSFLKGVIKAMPVPLNMFFFHCFIDYKVKGPWVRRRACAQKLRKIIVVPTKPSNNCAGHGCSKQGRWHADSR